MAENHKANALGFLKHLKMDEPQPSLQQMLLHVEFTLMMCLSSFTSMHQLITKIIYTALDAQLVLVPQEQSSLWQRISRRRRSLELPIVRP